MTLYCTYWATTNINIDKRLLTHIVNLNSHIVHLVYVLEFQNNVTPVQVIVHVYQLNNTCVKSKATMY